MIEIEHTRFTCDHCEELGQGIILSTLNGDEVSAIGLCNDCAAYFGKEMNHSLITTIESQKAITELAVKGLMEIIDDVIRCNYTSVRDVASNTLSEIERLSHAK